MPPLARTPQGVTSLKLAQRGDALEVSYVAPRATTSGLRLAVFDIEILRADTAGEFLKVARRDRRRAAPGEALSETSPLPPAGTTVRVAARAVDGGHVSALTSVASLTVQPPPPAPTELAAELKGEVVALRWAGTIPSPPPTPPPPPVPAASPGASPAPAVAPAAIPATPPRATPGLGATPRSAAPSPSPKPPARGFLVYRHGPARSSYDAPLRTEPLAVNAFEDRAVTVGQRLCYVVTTVASTDPAVESAPSNEACVAVRDVVAPATPTGVATLGGPDGIEISWSPSLEPDLASYRVYRETEGKRELLGEVKPPETSWRDTTAEPGRPYTYTLIAVDRAENESPPSTPVPGRRP